MKSLWRSLSNAGVTGNQPYVLVRRIRLQNQVSLLFILFLIFFSGLNVFNNKLTLAAVEFAFIALLILPLYLNYKAHYSLSAILFFLELFALVISIFLNAPKRELEYLLLVLGVVPLTSYKSKRIIYSLFSISFILFIAAKVVVNGLEDFVAYLNYALIFLLAFFTVRYLKVEFENNLAIIETQNVQLTKLNDEKNQLISIASHDLRSPLNRIQSLLSLLAMEGSLTSGQKEILRTAQLEAKNQTEMIKEILDLYAIDEGKKTFTLKNIEILTMITDLIHSFQSIADNKNITIQIENKTDNTHAFADQVYLKQVFENLLSNALKFSYSNSKITIIVRALHQTMVISFKDEGQGLDEEDQKKLFKRFQRLSAQPTAGEPTSGLGLSIAKKYVEAMKGSLTCVSEKGKGATFTVELPLAQA